MIAVLIGGLESLRTGIAPTPVIPGYCKRPLLCSMSIHFHPLVIKEIAVKHRIVSVLFEVPGTLAADFKFTQGAKPDARTRIGGGGHPAQLFHLFGSV